MKKSAGSKKSESMKRRVAQEQGSIRGLRIQK